MSFLKDYNNDEINDIVEDAWEIGWFKSNITFKSISVSYTHLTLPTISDV